MSDFTVNLFGDNHRYRICNSLGSGSYGRVNLVHIEEVNIKLAMKVISFTSPETEASARQEHRILSSLMRDTVHPNVIAMFASKEFPGQLNLFMEYAGSQSLDKLIPSSGMTQPEAGGYFRQLMEGVRFIHWNGITHCDIKPSNTLITKAGVLKIIDFGVSYEHLYENEERKVPSKRGTIKYSAPEILGSEDVEGPPVDIWSCAMTLVKLLTGSVPWIPADPNKSEAFKMWIENRVSFLDAPWNSIDRIAFDMIDNMLEIDVERRGTVGYVMNHCWFKSAYKNPRRTPISAVDESGEEYMVDLEPLLAKYNVPSPLEGASPVQPENPPAGSQRSAMELNRSSVAGKSAQTVVEDEKKKSMQENKGAEKLDEGKTEGRKRELEEKKVNIQEKAPVQKKRKSASKK